LAATGASNSFQHATISEEEEEPALFSTVLIEQNERERGANFSTAVFDKNPPPIPPRSNDCRRPSPAPESRSGMFVIFNNLPPEIQNEVFALGLPPHDI
jgi:hypothetical protein